MQEKGTSREIGKWGLYKDILLMFNYGKAKVKESWDNGGTSDSQRKDFYSGCWRVK